MMKKQKGVLFYETSCSVIASDWKLTLVFRVNKLVREN